MSANATGAARGLVGNLLKPFRWRDRPVEPTHANQAINFDRQSIFIAIPKTGTTSIRSQIRPQGPALIPNPHLNVCQVRELMYIWLLRRTLGTNAAFSNPERVSDAELRAESARLFRSFYKFTIVRNPWDRAVSLYLRNEGVQTRHRLSFESFCEQLVQASDTCRQPTRHGCQIDWITDEHGAIAVDRVLKLEEMEAGLRAVAEDTGGRLQLQNLSANRNQARSGDYREFHTARTRALIQERFRRDIEAFDYSF